MSAIPPQYGWLNNEPGPPQLKEAIKLYGTAEIKGGKHNPDILAWADEVNPTIGAWYDSDEKAWCGLFVAVCLKRSGFSPPASYDALRAMSYQNFGIFVHPRQYSIGDIAIFKREGGGHVGFLVGEDQECFHVLGGNQGDRVCVSRLQKFRLQCVVRPEYGFFPPRKIPFLRPSGGISRNEA